MWLRSVVFPDPRNPVSTVIGIRLSWSGAGLAGDMSFALQERDRELICNVIRPFFSSSFITFFAKSLEPSMARVSKTVPTPPAKKSDGDASATTSDRIVLVVEATAAAASAWPASVVDFVEPLLKAAALRKNASTSASASAAMMTIPSSRSPSPNRTGGGSSIGSSSSWCPGHEFALVCYRAHAPFAPAAVTRR